MFFRKRRSNPLPITRDEFNQLLMALDRGEDPFVEPESEEDAAKRAMRDLAGRARAAEKKRAPGERLGSGPTFARASMTQDAPSAKAPRRARGGANKYGGLPSTAIELARKEVAAFREQMWAAMKADMRKQDANWFQIEGIREDMKAELTQRVATFEKELIAQMRADLGVE